MADPESMQIRRYLLDRRSNPNAPTTLEGQRVSYELLVENYTGPLPLPVGTRVEPIEIDRVPAEWIYPSVTDAERVMLFMHGGAYVLGSLKSHRDLVARLANEARVRSLQIDYRRAPEHPFPAALDDTLIVYRWLLARGTKPEHIILAGDSAGAGLALALLQALRDKNMSMPTGAVLFSPWTDLAGTVESRSTRESSDPIFTGKLINSLGPLYAGSEDIHNPLISPINADLHGLPPLLIEVGRDEVLLDDSLVIAEHARAANVPVELTVWDDMWHVFQQFAYVLPEAQQSLEKAGKFIRRQLKLS
ncbi:alpha/beta hydrolase [Ktedonosporobacter rubrisoli]|nr:alpha/beta hydrolase [Ktedonosporobacter rubrisoli]